MRKILVIFVIAAFISTGAAGQQGPKKMKIYDTWIQTISPAEKQKGYVYEFLNDSIALVYKDGFEAGKIYPKSELAVIPLSNIDVLSSRRKGSLWKGTLIGFGTGFLLGGIIGYFSYDENDGMSVINELGAAAIVAIPLGAVGAGIGAAIGTGRVKHPVHGNVKYYERVKDGLKKRSVVYYYQ